MCYIYMLCTIICSVLYLYIYIMAPSSFRYDLDKFVLRPTSLPSLQDAPLLQQRQEARPSCLGEPSCHLERREWLILGCDCCTWPCMSCRPHVFKLSCASTAMSSALQRQLCTCPWSYHTHVQWNATWSQVKRFVTCCWSMGPSRMLRSPWPRRSGTVKRIPWRDSMSTKRPWLPCMAGMSPLPSN